MTPVPSPNDITEDPEDQTLNELVSELTLESDSDDGSEMDKECDDYLPRAYDIENEVLPDERYNIDLMEMNGKYETDHTYQYVDLEEEIIPPTNLYNGLGPCFRRGVTECIHNLLDAMSICGGFDYNFGKMVTANSNEYARSHLDSRGRISGYPWHNIMTQEMYLF